MNGFTHVFGACALDLGLEQIQGEIMGVWAPHSAGAAVIAETRDYLAI